MNKIIIFLSLIATFSLFAMEERPPKRKSSEISQAPEKEKEKEHPEQCPTSGLKTEQVAYYGTKLHIVHSPRKIIKWLAKSTDPNIEDRAGRTAINALIDKGYLEAAFHLAIRKGNLDVNTPDNYGMSPLCRAIKHQDLPLARLILEILKAQHKTNASKKGTRCPALLLAVQFLPDFVEEVANLDPLQLQKITNHLTPLMFAMGVNQDSVPFLLKAGANPDIKNNDGDTALTYAVRYYPKIIPLLHELKVDINVQNGDGMTPLMVAIRDNKDAIQPLLDTRAADLNIQNNLGYTPLMFAVQFKPEVIDMLIKAGADPNPKINLTPLMIAAKFQPSAIPILHAAGADLNAQTDQGTTPLMIAIRYDNKDSVQFLINVGANVNLTNNKGETALYYAIQKDQPDIVKMLLAAKAKVTEKDIDAAKNNVEIQKLLNAYKG